MYIILYTVSSKPRPFVVVVDKLEDLATAVDKIKKKGLDVTIKIYEASIKNYTLTNKDKSRTVIDKIPKITLT